MASSLVCRLLLLYHPHVTQTVKHILSGHFSLVCSCLLLFTLVYLTQAQELLDSDNLWPFFVTQSHSFMSRQCAKFQCTANCVGLWRTVPFLYPATTYAHCHVPWYKSVIQLGFSFYSIHNLVPVALSSVYPVETFTLLYNLYIVTHPSSSQPFLCTVLWIKYFLCSSQKYVTIAKMDTWEKQLLHSVMRNVT